MPHRIPPCVYESYRAKVTTTHLYYSTEHIANSHSCRSTCKKSTSMVRITTLAHIKGSTGTSLPDALLFRRDRRSEDTKPYMNEALATQNTHRRAPPFRHFIFPPLLKVPSPYTKLSINSFRGCFFLLTLANFHYQKKKLL